MCGDGKISNLISYLISNKKKYNRGIITDIKKAPHFGGAFYALIPIQLLVSTWAFVDTLFIGLHNDTNMQGLYEAIYA